MSLLKPHSKTWDNTPIRDWPIEAKRELAKRIYGIYPKAKDTEATAYKILEKNS